MRAADVSIVDWTLICSYAKIYCYWWRFIVSAQQTDTIVFIQTIQKVAAL